jgi:hypothetical protein
MKHALFFVVLLLTILFISPVELLAQIKWDGGAGTSEWSDAANWAGDVVPATTDSVVLDNSYVTAGYTVNLPGGTTNTAVARIRITPTPPNIITLILPVTNTSTSGALTLGDGVGDPYDFRLDSLAVFMYRSGAASGTPFTFVNSTDSLWLGNGATWNHNCRVGQTGIANKLSKKAGTEHGLFIYDMTTLSPASIQFQNITYGSVILSGASSGFGGTSFYDTKKYITTGSSACNIRGNFTIEANARDSSTMTNVLNIKGNCTINGFMRNAPVATARTIVFNGTSEQILSGSDTTNFMNGITVNAGSTVTLNCNLSLNAVQSVTTPHIQTLTVSGTLNCGTHTITGIGNVIVNSSGTLSSGSPDGITSSGATGTVQVSGTRTFPSTASYGYTGTSPQVTGNGLPSTINNFIINGSGGVTLSAPTTINGTLTLTSGVLNLGSNNLYLSAATTIAGTPTASNMVVATGSGILKKALSGAAPHSFTFPVGDNTGTSEYSPVTYTLNSGTFSVDTIGIRLSNAKHASNSYATDYLNRYWTLSSGGVTSPNYTAVFTYVPADVVGNEASLAGGWWNGSTWSMLGVVNTGAHTFTASSQTQFGDFTGIPGLGYVTIKIIPQGYYDQGDFLHAKDTIKAYLANGNSPYNLIDSVSALLDSLTFSSIAGFSNAPSGNYYLVVKHRSCIETWSAGTLSFTKGYTVAYDFTNAQTKAYGSNLVQVSTSPVRWAIYSGDVNQDGFVDPLDLAIVDQASFDYLAGRGLASDINGDGFVDPLDLAITDENSFNYAGIKKP